MLEKNRYSLEMLHRAHLKARKNKRHKNEVIYFELHLSERLSERLSQLGKALAKDKFSVKYYHFAIHEPKHREVYATNYATRVSLHVLSDEYLKPILGKRLIYDNAACQEGKGTHFAMKRLTYFMTKFYRKHGQEGYALKCDVRKYFNEIDQEILFEKLREVIKDQHLLTQLKTILASYHTQGHIGKGLPLGNQTSQWFALYYLDAMDRWIKEKHRMPYYIRYMDDFIILSPCKKELQNLLIELKKFLKDEKLTLNHKTQIYPLSKGVEFLGFRFFLKPAGKVIRRLRSASKKRMKKRLKESKDSEIYSQVQQSYLAHLNHGTCDGLARQIRKNI